MHDQPPYVEAKDYIEVRALVRGVQADAVVLGWRGDRVYLFLAQRHGLPSRAGGCGGRPALSPCTA